MLRLALLLLISCGDREEADGEAPSAVTPTDRAVAFSEDEELEGLRFTLRSVTPPSESVEGARIATGTALASEQIDRLLARTEPLVEQAGDKKAFALRPASEPPPRAGATALEPFPPPPAATDRPAPAPSGPLHVTRHAPDGDLAVVPHVMVSFDQPMIAVGTQPQASEQVPVRLEPQPPGRWRWLGTQTLQFDPEGRSGEPEGRLPASTAYTVTIPAGTKSATGGTLAEAVSFSFRTPTVNVTQLSPQDGPHGLRPVIAMTFDQAVDPKEVLAHARLEGGGQRVELRIATDAEVEGDALARDWKGAAQKDRFVALALPSDLRKATAYSFAVTKGLRSLEGPRTTEADQRFGFSTYAPLAIVSHECGWDRTCTPDMGWTIRTNNPLDPDAFDPASVTIDPPFDATIGVSGSSIVIQGQKDGRKRYTVHVPASLKDTFGQTLGKAEDVDFDVGPANRTVYGPNAQMIVLDPGQKPSFPVWTTNHDALKVAIDRVTPSDWPAWQRFLRTWQYDDAKPGKRPGAVLQNEVVQVEKAPDRLVETDLDLGRWLEDGHGQFLVWVEPTTQPKNRWERQYAYAWVQVTDLGLTAFVDPDEAIVWTASLRSGDPIEGVELEMVHGQRATSGSDGLARLQLPESVPADADGYSAQQIVIARKGSDLAILPESSSWYGGGSWVKQSQLDQLTWFVFDDRGIYRPKENVRVKGWLRRQEMRTHGDLGALGDAAPTSIHWTLTSATGNAMGEGDAKVSQLGGFDLGFTIPDTANLGTAQLTLTAQGSSLAWTTWTHPIEIQEFRRPEFEVVATAPEGRWTLGEEATFSVDAHYYAGGGLAAAEVSWDVTATATSYSPPGHDGFTFGQWIPWWWGGGRGGWWGREEPRTVESLQSTTDASGKHAVAAHFVAVNPPRPTNVSAEASVTDVNRQRWTSTATLLVHPAAVYVGLRTERAFVDAGDRIEVDVVTVDPDGKALATEAAVRAVRNDWGFVRGTWIEVEKDAQDCTVAASTSIEHCRFDAKAGGRWTITATVRDDRGRKNETELSIWVAGGSAPPNRSLAREEVTLVPEKELYAPGETARLLVQAPFAPAEGTMTIQRSGIVEQKRFRMDGVSTTLEIPILEEHVPNVSVQVDVVGLQTRTDDRGDARSDLAKRSAYASGTVTYQVSTLQRKLAVEVRPGAEKLVPGGKTTIEIEVKDAAKAPVAGAELAVVVADESVLALSDYQLPDPLAAFYAARSPDTRTTDLREAIWLADPHAVAEAPTSGFGDSGVRRRSMGMAMDAAAPMAGEEMMLMKEESRAEPKAKNVMMMQAPSPTVAAQSPSGPAIALRTNFDALALFAPEVRTDAKGRASVDLALPDSLTRYRVMVVAVAGDKLFGAGESNVTARLPLMVRPSAPRFLQFGDSFELPIVLQNQTDDAMKVDVAVRATSVTFVDRVSDTLPDVPDAPYSQAGLRVTVPANDRVEVRFPTSTRMAGTARFQAVATAGGASDAARFELPVWTPATTEAFATYGTTEGAAVVQPIAAPKDVWPQFGGLDVETSSTQLQALTDAVLYLQHYPYDCNEQIASRLMAIAALRDVLEAFESPNLPPRAALEAQVARDLERLHDRQNGDGGFAFWRRGDESWPYLGIYVAHAYAEAKSKGYTVRDDSWGRSKRYLERIESHIPGWYSAEEKWFLRAYAVHVRWRMGDTDAGEAKEILRASGSKRLSLEGHGFLLPVLFAAKETAIVQQELQYLANHGAETAAALSFGDAYEHGEYVLLASSRRADGVILSALLSVSPESDMVPKIVNGLLAHRKKGHWANTQEDTFILLALDRYFRAYEKTTPDFVARIWLGEGYAGEHAFRGRTTERSRIEIPIAYLTDPAETRDLVIDKQGAGRLYYRVAMRYAPRDLKLAPADVGFYVQRAYEAIDDPKDVRQDADGSWHIAAGSRVRVRLTMVAQARRYHVALVDPLPAGLEAQNPVLATTGTLPADPKQSGKQPWWFWWTRTWYEHENLRDDRVEAFASLLNDGAWEYTYVARATTPGRFVVPPAKAEEMYSPETFGRSGTDRVVID